MGQCRLSLPWSRPVCRRRGDVARGPRTPRRTEATREPYDRVLIVTEGTRTEPSYLADLVAHYRLNTANVAVVPSERGSDPGTVVATALSLRDEEVAQRDAYDRVYCVFDRDGHTNFDAASRRAEAESLLLARSWPCFEYWLLLHFVFTRAPFGRTGGRSSCDNCVLALRKHFTDYRKATPGVFDRLVSQLETAKAHARRALDDAADDGEWNPSTEMHKLVEYLQALKA